MPNYVQVKKVQGGYIVACTIHGRLGFKSTFKNSEEAAAAHIESHHSRSSEVTQYWYQGKQNWMGKDEILTEFEW